MSSGNERVPASLGVHSTTGVPYLERDVFAGHRPIRRNHLVNVGLADLFKAGDDPNCFGPSFLHGLGGVDDQVHDELLELSGIAFDCRQIIL